MFSQPLNTESKSLGIRQLLAMEQFGVFVSRQAHYRSRSGDVFRWIRKAYRIQIVDVWGLSLNTHLEMTAVTGLYYQKCALTRGGL